jgi:hypothetical protein
MDYLALLKTPEATLPAAFLPGNGRSSFTTTFNFYF